jgi:hypothetical protein
MTKGYKEMDTKLMAILSLIETLPNEEYKGIFYGALKESSSVKTAYQSTVDIMAVFDPKLYEITHVKYQSWVQAHKEII